MTLIFISVIVSQFNPLSKIMRNPFSFSWNSQPKHSSWLFYHSNYHHPFCPTHLTLEFQVFAWLDSTTCVTSTQAVGWDVGKVGMIEVGIDCSIANPNLQVMKPIGWKSIGRGKKWEKNWANLWSKNHHGENIKFCQPMKNKHAPPLYSLWEVWMRQTVTVMIADSREIIFTII